MRVIWAPRALARVTEIAESIAADRPDAASRWVVALFDRVATLRHHPRRGRRVPEVMDRNDLREVLHGAYRVIYRVEVRRLVVLTVRHGRRQWDTADLEDNL